MRLRLPPFLLASCIGLLLWGMTGCTPQAENPHLQELQHQLAELEGQIAAARQSLAEAQARHEEARAEAAIVGDIRGGFRSQMVWNHSGPLLSGTIRNDSAVAFSSVTIDATREGPHVADQELLVVRFTPILLPGSDRAFSVEASPFIWGFQEPQPSGFHRHLLTEVVLANGQTLRDDFSATRRGELELERQRKALLDIQLHHGSVHQKLTQAIQR
jgi:hypothetical protein